MFMFIDILILIKQDSLVEWFQEVGYYVYMGQNKVLKEETRNNLSYLCFLCLICNTEQ